MTDAERLRLAAADEGTAAWRRWGPYLAERAWGTVREDYSAGGNAWEYLPHDHARSRAYRWNEDGIAGWCDDHQHACLAMAFWNGVDPILKERFFGLTGNEGNHGEDVKEYWWYLDGTPSHAYQRMRYHYPQAPFPYERLVDETRRRGRDDAEFELADTGVFDDGRWWGIEVTYAKSSVDTVCVEIACTNHGPDMATLHVLPTVWFRNTWSWTMNAKRPSLRWDGRFLRLDHDDLGPMALVGDGDFDVVCCDNDTNMRRLFDSDGGAPYPKDGINDRVVSGAATVDPALSGTKAALWYRLRVAAGATSVVRLRFGAAHEVEDPLLPVADVVARRRAEADAFHASLLPAGTSDDDAFIARQAFAGLTWSKQWYHVDIARWLDGDPTQPPPPAGRSRNRAWRHLNNADVLLVPDAWEYPWYASWDLAFHAVAYAHLDPTFAKQQLVLLCREWYMHPNGQIPAYEWAFSDVNPPVQAWATLRIFEIDGERDVAFVERMFHKLLLNFTWWVNRKDAEGNNVFEGGFLGLDNIGPIDRGATLPSGVVLEQSDGTAWMAKYCLDLLEMALMLAVHAPVYEDVATKFFEHFIYIATAMNSHGLWNEGTGFYHDLLSLPDGRHEPVLAFSAVGLIPLCAVTIVEPDVRDRLVDFAARMEWFIANRRAEAVVVAHSFVAGRRQRLLLSIVDPQRLDRILGAMLDEARLLSPYGVRSLSREHASQPVVLRLGGVTHTLGYEPAESRTATFGGNSNWRGPVWFPINHLLIESLRRFRLYLGRGYTVAHPTGTGRRLDLDEIADDLTERLIGLFRRNADGRRPCHGEVPLFRDPRWGDDVLFHEYFHGDIGCGLGASHQTGWTALVADLIVRRVPPA
jgi:hypothetical protein